MVTVIIMEIAGNLHAPFGWLSKSWWRSSRDSCWGQKWWHSCLMNSMVDDKHWVVWWSYTWDCYGNHICSWPKFEICTTLPDFHILFIDYCRLIPHPSSTRQFPTICYGNCRDSTANAIQTWNGTLIFLSIKGWGDSGKVTIATPWQTKYLKWSINRTNHSATDVDHSPISGSELVPTCA